MNTQVKNKYITLHYIKIILKWAGDQLNYSVALQEKILRHARTLRTGKMACSKNSKLWDYYYKTKMVNNLISCAVDHM